jgi:hypothetical protein
MSSRFHHGSMWLKIIVLRELLVEVSNVKIYCGGRELCLGADTKSQTDGPISMASI